MPQPRELLKAVILTVVTCGIYGIIWLAQLGSDIAQLRGDEQPPVTRDIILLFVTCGLWSFFIAYFWTTWLVEGIERQGGHPDRNLPVLALVLAFFTGPLGPKVLIQQTLNDHLNAQLRNHH